MNINKLHNKLISSRTTIPVSIFVVFVLRILAGISFVDFYAWIIFLIQVGISISFMHINHTYTIIQKRTMLPSLIYLLLISNPMYYHDLTGSIACLCITFCIIFMFSSYQNPNSQINTFNIFVLLTICSFLWSPVLFLIPLILFGLYRFQALNFKTFNASIIGIVTVELFMLSWSIYKNDIKIFIDFCPDFNGLFQFKLTDITLLSGIYIGFLLILLLISRINSFVAKSSEKIRTSLFIQYLYLLTIYALVLFLFSNDWNNRWIQIALIPTAFLISHYFTMNVKKLSSYLLLFAIIFYLGYDIYLLMIA